MKTTPVKTYFFKILFLFLFMLSICLGLFLIAYSGFTFVTDILHYVKAGIWHPSTIIDTIIKYQTVWPLSQLVHWATSPSEGASVHQFLNRLPVWLIFPMIGAFFLLFSALFYGDRDHHR